MGKLVITMGWPYNLTPNISYDSILMSDVRLEPNLLLLRSKSTDADASANMIIRAAIESGATELLSLCADQALPPDVLSRMRAHNKDVVGALTATRQTGHHWLVFNVNKDGWGHQFNPKWPLQKADVVGPGCMLIKMHIFNRVPPPWFKTTYTADGCGVVQSSDFYFFKKLKEYGVDVFVDSTLESDHETTVVLNSKTLNRKLPYIEAIEGYTKIPGSSTEQLALDKAAGVYVDGEATLINSSDL